MNNAKPIVVYLHRYPPEVEALQWPALAELAEELAPTYDFYYFCMGPPGERRDPLLRQLIRVRELPFTVDQADGRDKWLKTIRWYWHMGRIRREILRLAPAVILCKETLPLIPGWIVRTGVPTIIGTSDWWWSILFGHLPGARWLVPRLESGEVRGWNRPNARAVTGTQAAARLLAARGMDPERIVVINEPRNPAIFRPLDPLPSKTELGLDETLKYVAMFGIIRGGKGYEQILDWWKLAVQAHPDWRLVIIGGAGGEGWCRRQIVRRDLQNHVFMTGWLPTKQEVNRWLNAMDAILVQRRNSPDNQGIIPSALYNGLATGRPVVAVGLPGIAEIVRDEVDGFLYTPDDPVSFLAALEKALLNPEEAESAARAGATRAEECFDSRRAARRYRELVDELAAVPQPE